MIIQSHYALGFVRTNDHNSRDAAYALCDILHWHMYDVDVYVFLSFQGIFLTNQINCNRSYMQVNFIPCYGP